MDAGGRERAGALMAAVTLTGLTALVTLPLAFALLRNGSTTAALVALAPVLLVALVTVGRLVVPPDGDEQDPPPGSHEAL